MIEYLLLLFLVIPIAAVVFNGFPGADRRFLWGGLWAHALGALAQWAIVFGYYGGGDSSSYMFYGRILARMIRTNPSQLIDVWGLAFNMPPLNMEWVIGAGVSTGAMSGWAGLFSLVLNESVPAVLLACAMIAFIGQIGFYTTFRRALPTQYRQRIAIATFFVPSLVFWTSGLLKETFALGGIGVATFGAHLLVTKGITRPANWLVFLAGATFLGIFKPYALVPLGAAAAVWFFAARAVAQGGKVRLKFRYILGGTLAAIAVVALVGVIFPQLQYDSALEETARLQGAYQNIEAGSTYQLGGTEDRTFTQQIIYLPLALVSAFFRPFIFEAHNAVSLLNAIETFIILILVGMIFSKLGPRRIWQIARTQPFILFAIVFVFLFAAAVGLAAPNLGTLSRYRTLMFPIYVGLILALLPMPKPRQRHGRKHQHQSIGL